MTTLLTKKTVVNCPHGGIASVVEPKSERVAISSRADNARVLRDELIVLTEADEHVVAGCPNPVETKGPECKKIVWKGTGSKRLSVDGNPVLTSKSKGEAVSGETKLGTAKINLASLLDFEWVDEHT